MAEYECLEELVVGLFDADEIGYVRSAEEFITLESGRKSPYYVSLRGVMSFPPGDSRRLRHLRGLAVDGYVHGLESAIHPFDHMAGIPQAMNTIAGAIALQGGFSALGVRTPEPEKGYGKHKPIEGNYEKGEVVVGVDNVITVGDTKKEFVEPVAGAGLILKEFVVLVNREEGGRANMAQLGYELTEVIGMRRAHDILNQNHRLSPDQVAWTNDYFAQYGD